MPAKSKAQMRYLFAAAARGDIPQSVAENFAVGAKKFKKLPEHVKANADHVHTQPRKHSDET
jgi:hypothetical protein